MCNRIERLGQTKKHRNSGGFSLIELSIVLTVIGLLFVPLVRIYDAYKTSKIITDTKFALGQASQSLTNFYEKEGRYPCPSDRSIGFGQPGHGRELCTELWAMGNGACASGGGYCRAGTTPANAVFIGGFPYVTMEIPMTEAIDGWNNMFTYAVTASMADPSPTAVFDPDNGAVTVRDEFGNPLPLNTPRPVHGVVFSAGSDGVGAYSVNGVPRACRLGNVQTENCNNDAVFVASYLYEQPGPSYIDDFLFLTDWSRNSIWAYSPNEDAEPGSVYSTNPGNIGIGTETPDAKLDVVGNLRSDQVHSDNFCNHAGEDCMQPSIVGGAGDTCDTAGELMVGIDHNNVRCAPVPAQIVSDTCPNSTYPTGRYVIGIANNRIICGP